HDRDAKLAPFISLANRRIQNAPPEKRLELLLQRVSALTEAASKLPGYRHLSPEAVVRIQNKLDRAPRIEVEVGGMMGDIESLGLAEELRTAFVGAGINVRETVHYVRPERAPVGVVIFSRHELDSVLG